MRNYGKYFIFILICLVFFDSCGETFGDQHFDGDIYFSIPRNITYTKIEIIVKNNNSYNNKELATGSYVPKDILISDNYNIWFNKSYPNSNICPQNNLDIYHLELYKFNSSTSDKIVQGDELTGEIKIYNNSNVINEYSFVFEIQDNLINSFDFPIYNIDINQINLNGFFYSESDYEYYY